MKKSSDIKPIPKRILEQIRKFDFEQHPDQKGRDRWYSYLTSIKGDLVKITVVCKTFYKKWHCKQVAARGVKSELIWIKDMVHHRMAGYIIGWTPENYKPHAYRQWYADGIWYSEDKRKDKRKGIQWNPWSMLINPEYAWKFKEYQYSAHQLFRGDCIIEYLKLYVKFPQTEYLVKLGLNYLHDKITILQRIAKDRKFCKWLINHRNELTADYNVYAGTVIQAYKTGKPIKQIQKIEEFKKTFKNNRDIPMLQGLFGENLESFFDYVAKQDTDPSSYTDYIKACQYLRLDLTRPENLKPSNFLKMHDRRIAEQAKIKAKLDKEKRAELYEKFAIVSEKYLPLQNCKPGTYAVMIAKDPGELVYEGEQLKHCVGGGIYDEKMAREETLIFFIRAIGQLSVPFFTIEYSIKQKKILQCYGKSHAKPDETVQAFVNQVWLPYANRTLRKLAKAA